MVALVVASGGGVKGEVQSKKKEKREKEISNLKNEIKLIFNFEKFQFYLKNIFLNYLTSVLKVL